MPFDWKIPHGVQLENVLKARCASKIFGAPMFVSRPEEGRAFSSRCVLRVSYLCESWLA